MPVAIVFALALFAWLCVQGTTVLQKTLQGMLDSIPLIGGALARFVSFDWGILVWLWEHVDPAGRAFTQINVNHATEQGLNVQAHKATHDAISRVQTVTVPAAVDAKTVPIAAQLQQVAAAQKQTTTGVQTFDTWAGGQIQALGHATAVTLPGQIATVRRQLTTELQQGLTAEQQSLVRVATSLGQSIQAAESTAATNLARTTDALRGDIGQAATAAEAGAIRAVQPQIGGLATDLGAIAQQITGVITPSLVQQAAITTALSQVLTQVEQCTLGICETGSGPTLGNLGKDLQGIGSVWELGLLFAMVAEAVVNPRASADTVATVAGPVASAGVAVIRGAVGLAEAA